MIKFQIVCIENLLFFNLKPPATSSPSIQSVLSGLGGPQGFL